MGLYISTHIWNAPDMVHARVHDNAPCHKKKADDALNAFKMRQSTGKVCKSVPLIRDTEWVNTHWRKGVVGKKYKQSMVVSKLGPKADWFLKGVQLVGYERGIWDNNRCTQVTVAWGKTERWKQKTKDVKVKFLGLS
jgi:hypothetical protein